MKKETILDLILKCLFLLLGVLFWIWIGFAFWKSQKYIEKKQEYHELKPPSVIQESFNTEGFFVIDNCFVSSYFSYVTPKVFGDMIGEGWTEEEIKKYIKEKYPEMEWLLLCMLKKESTYCKHLKGDNGKAYGCWQIHIDKHEITEECALDFECSTEWSVNKIRNGEGYLWTSYKSCLGK